LGQKKNTGKPLHEPDDVTIEIIRNRLNAYMQQQKPFLKQHYTIKNLSDDMQMPSWQLSAFLNKHLGVHYSEYMNQFRIKYCEDLINQELSARVNLKELVSKCGFHNRNTFTTAFKKFTGKTPSEYVRTRAHP